VRRRLEETGLEGREVNVDTEEGLSEAAGYGVMAAPTVILFGGGGTEVARAYNAGDLEVLLANDPENLPNESIESIGTDAAQPGDPIEAQPDSLSGLPLFAR
jgi:hypothetical protein